MLERLRTSRAARAALLAAAFFSIVGAFGLHPEPLSAGPPGSLPQISTPGTAGVGHGCLACLTHGVGLTSPRSGTISESGGLQALPLARESSLRSLLAAGRTSGRAPPARS